MSPETMVLVVLVGLCVGIISALFGVGGGIIMVPFMVLVLGKGQHLAEGTSLLVIVPTAVAGVIAHRKAGYVTLKSVLAIGMGGVVGAVLGARGALLLDAPMLETLFSVFVAIVGIRLILQGLRPGGPSDEQPLGAG